MRVLAVTFSYPPWSRVGAWISTHECLRALVERGHDVEVRTHDRRAVGVVDNVVVSGGFDGVVDGFDVVVFHHGDRWSRTFELASSVGVRAVQMVHGEPGAVIESRGVLNVWNSESSRAGRPGPVVRPHVDPDEFATTPGGMVTLVNLSREKGGRMLGRIAARMPDRRFLGVRGGWGEQVDLRAANVEVIPTTGDMSGDVYSRTRVLLMPSKSETWGRVGVEAMASGIPVVAAPTPGLRESLGDAGIFVELHDVAGWVRVLRDLEDPAVWSEWSGRALARSAELDTRGDLDVFCDAVESLVGVSA